MHGKHRFMLYRLALPTTIRCGFLAVLQAVYGGQLFGAFVRWLLCALHCMIPCTRIRTGHPVRTVQRQLVLLNAVSYSMHAACCKRVAGICSCLRHLDGLGGQSEALSIRSLSSSFCALPNLFICLCCITVVAGETGAETVYLDRQPCWHGIAL